MRSILARFATGAAAPPLSDPGVINRLYRRHRIGVLVAITIGYALAYTCRLALSVVKKPLIDEGIFSPQDLGLIGSALFYSYAFGKLVNGFLADHANIKIFFATGVIASALINVGMGFSTILWLSVALWTLNGWFQGFGAPSGAVTLTAWFSNRERGRYYGIWSTAHSMGEGLTFYVVALFVTWLGWRAGFWVPGLICILAGVGIYVLMKDRPVTLGLPPIADWKNDHLAEAAPKDARVVKLQFSILRIPAVWVLAASSATVYVTRYAIASWGILYLQEERGYGLADASIFMAIGTVAGIAGCLLYGFTSDTLFRARRPPTNLLFAIAELAGLFLIFFGPSDSVTLTAGFILFGLGLNGLVTSLGGLFAIDISPKKVAGAAMGFIGVFSYLGAAIQENVSGALIESGMQVVDGVRHYDFGPAITFWIGSSAVSMLLAATLWRVRLRE